MSTVSDPEASEKVNERRRWRYTALEWLRGNSSRTSASSCMHAAGASVTLAATAAGVTHVGGVTRCGSPWACSVCSPTIGERRATEIDQAIAAWLAQGGLVFFVTATLAHGHGDQLDRLLAMLQGSWSRTFRWGGGVSPAWYGGQIRAVEITHGGNGWHPHVHAAVFVEPGWADDAAAIEAELWDLRHQWCESVELHGGTTSTSSRRSPGWDVRPVSLTGSLGSYLSKVEGGWGVGLELARLDLKQHAKGTTPAELLRQAVAGDARAAVLFGIYERATAGKRRIVSSPGLMARCGVEVLDDDQAAEAELAEAPTVVVSVPAADWRRMLSSGWAARLIDDVGRFAAGGGPWGWPPGWLVVSLHAAAAPAA